MKWLFAVLVALNVMVFGGMVAGRVAEKQKAVVEPTVPLVSGTHELSLPPPLYHEHAPAASAPDWIHAESAENNNSGAEAEREQKAQEEKLAREKKARDARAGGSFEQAETASAQCSATAAVTLDEDDYHRIKGLLNKWPHAATRTVEQRRRSVEKAAAPQKNYRVLLPGSGDVMAQMDSLAAKGFTASLYNGEVSVGVVRSKSAAQVLMSRLAGAGFGGAHVREQEERAAVQTGNSLSIGRMQVLFMSVDDKEAQAIQAIVGKYGKLNRRACR
ncbi:hypothetical protein LVJ83_02315 [Uruburuella testudinis]|uniref:Sporulation related protein n=1 Tax=Uruburuella testudinis TaxID=1282863 RepID=A0ABY4DWA6_9NEIS|nr:hypothetical protein [Uruburuella testudinis]UOO82329.1 hypothetical protein LVJ83_02315 [Uruburuella testudinis]